MPATEASDGLFFDKAYRRLNVFLAVFSGLGAVGAFALDGVRGGAGFLVGAAFSALNFRWIKQLVHALGAKGPPRKAWQAVFFGMRYFLFGVLAYGIVKVFGINILSVLAGLLVAAAAVIAEILYELIYART
jgi:hypothetical protein